MWVILNSFREKGLIRKDSFSIPTPANGFTLDNYTKAMDRFDFGSAYLNSLIVSVSVTLVVVVLAGLAAYGLVRYRFRLRGVCYSLIMAGMMFPVFSTIIPVFRMEAAWGIASSSNRWLSLLAVILPGCNVFQVYFHIIMPAAKSSFATVAIFSFLWSYNDLFTQNFFLRYPHEKTITLLLNEISSQAGVDYGLMAASVVLIVIPVLAVYVLLQKHIIKGLTAGAIKG